MGYTRSYYEISVCPWKNNFFWVLRKVITGTLIGRSSTQKCVNNDIGLYCRITEEHVVIGASAWNKVVSQCNILEGPGLGTSGSG